MSENPYQAPRTELAPPTGWTTGRAWRKDRVRLLALGLLLSFVGLALVSMLIWWGFSLEWAFLTMFVILVLIVVPYSLREAGQRANIKTAIPADDVNHEQIES